MVGKFLSIGATIVKILIRSRLEGDLQDNFSDIVSVLEKLGLDAYEARTVNRGFEEIGDNIASSCVKILEKSNIKKDRAEVIAKCVYESYKNLELNNQNIFEYINNEEALRKKLLAVNQSYKKELDTREIEDCNQIIEDTFKNIAVEDIFQNGII